MGSTTDFEEFASRLREFMNSSLGSEATSSSQDSDFNRLALELFELQFWKNQPYQTLCASRKFTPNNVKTWAEIPAMPAAGFKELELSSLPPEDRTLVFHSSGTSEQRPSRHFHSRASLEISDSSLLPWFRLHLLADSRNREAGSSFVARPTFLILTPPPVDAPHSSLVYMFERIRREWGSEGSSFVGQAATEGGWSLDLGAALRALQQASERAIPLAILGTAFSFVHLLDELSAQSRCFKLCAGSRVLETGGYKGRSRALPRSELHSMITAWLGIPSHNIVSEYGMSELSSQAYDAVIGDQSVGARWFCFPPWARAQVVSPETGQEVADGETGLLRVYDLANIFSVLALQTEDMAIRRGRNFELIGRSELAEPRGCSLMAV